MAPASPCLPSLLFATSTTRLLARRAKYPNERSFGVRPARASITNISASARPIAASVCSCIRAVSEPLAPSSRPAVSMTVNSRSPSLACPSRRSRVTPGSSSTSASFCPTSRLNSVDLPTLGRPIMAMVKDIPDACALCGGPVNAAEGSALEAAARHRSGERGCRLLRLRCGLRRLGRGRIGRRRGGSTAHDLLRPWRRRRGGSGAVFIRRGLAIGRCSRRRRGGGRELFALTLGFSGLGFRLLDSLRSGSGCRRGILLLPLFYIGLVQILRHALLEPRHTVRKHRLAFTRQLLLGVQKIQQVGRIPVADAAAAAAQRGAQRDQDSRGGETWRTAHGGISLSSWRPAATAPAAP